jgi:hypothetical protein
VFTARYALSPYIKQIRSVFKGLTHHLILSSHQSFSFRCHHKNLWHFFLLIRSTHPAHLLKLHATCFKCFNTAMPSCSGNFSGTCVECVTVTLQSGQTCAAVSDISNSVSSFAAHMISHTLTSPLTHSLTHSFGQSVSQLLSLNVTYRIR